MRIRRRPPQPPPPPAEEEQQDPSTQVEASNDEARSSRREGMLHPEGDLPIDPHGGWWGGRRDPIHTRFLQDLPPTPTHHHHHHHHHHHNPAEIKTSSPPPQPDDHVNEVCIPDNLAGQMKLVQAVEKKDEEVDSDKMGGGQVNSNIKWSGSSSSGAELDSGEMVIMAAPGDGEMGKAKMRARRTSATSYTSNLGSSSAIDSKSSDDDDYTGPREVNGRKRKSPAVLMEGSRCSRVNGRGWRCCQQTLVGYSLCEHHLGKGRLRSMSSVRGQLGGSKGKKKRANGAASAAVEMPEMDHGEQDQDKSSVMKKRKKIGIVKARSISSLLGDTVHPGTTMMAAASPEAGEAMAAPVAVGASAST